MTAMEPAHGLMIDCQGLLFALDGVWVAHIAAPGGAGRLLVDKCCIREGTTIGIRVW